MRITELSADAYGLIALNLPLKHFAMLRRTCKRARDVINADVFLRLLKTSILPGVTNWPASFTFAECVAVARGFLEVRELNHTLIHLSLTNALNETSGFRPLETIRTAIREARLLGLFHTKAGRDFLDQYATNSALTLVVPNRRPRRLRPAFLDAARMLQRLALHGWELNRYTVDVSEWIIEDTITE